MGANPVFRIFWFVQRLRVVSSWNLESRISGSLPNMWNHQMFQKSIFSTRARDHFWSDMGANPVFWTFLFEVVRWWNLVCRYYYVYDRNARFSLRKVGWGRHHWNISLSVEVYCCSNWPQHEGQWHSTPSPKRLGRYLRAPNVNGGALRAPNEINGGLRLPTYYILGGALRAQWGLRGRPLRHCTKKSARNRMAISGTFHSEYYASCISAKFG